MKKTRGFTLTEVVIAMAIISILASMAYPSYVKTVKKSNRTTARQLVLDAAQRQETYRAQTLGYARTTIQLGYPTDPYVSQDGYFSIRVSAATPASPAKATAFTVTATALGDQVKDTCDGFSIDSTGLKAVTEGTVATCW